MVLTWLGAFHRPLSTFTRGLGGRLTIINDQRLSLAHPTSFPKVSDLAIAKIGYSCTFNIPPFPVQVHD